MRSKFPVFWMVILLLGVAWLLGELGVFNVDVPWIPVIVVVTALGMIYNRLNKNN